MAATDRDVPWITKSSTRELSMAAASSGMSRRRVDFLLPEPAGAFTCGLK